MQVRPFGERLGNFIVAAVAIPALAVLAWVGLLGRNIVVHGSADVRAVGGVIARGITPQQLFADAEAALSAPLAYVRDEDHNVLIGPLPLSAAKAKARECCDPDGVEVIDQTMPAYAEIDEAAKERLRVKIAERDNK